MSSFWNPPRASDEEVATTVASSGFHSVDVTRISDLLMDQLSFSFMHDGGGEFWAVLDIIRDLESGGTTRVRNASQFKRPPLKGLWHVHFVTAGFLAGNILLELKRSRKQWSARLDALLGSDMPWEEKASLIARESTTALFEKRRLRGAVTGEWVIFMKSDLGNIYLAAARHTTGEQDDELLVFLKCRCGPRFLTHLPT